MKTLNVLYMEKKIFSLPLHLCPFQWKHRVQSPPSPPMEIVLLTVSFVSSHINSFLIWRLLYSVSPKPPLGEMRSKRINQCKTTFPNAFFSLFQNSWSNTRKVGDILKRWDLIRETNVSHNGKPVQLSFRSYWKKKIK